MISLALSNLLKDRFLYIPPSGRVLENWEGDRGEIRVQSVPCGGEATGDLGEEINPLVHRYGTIICWSSEWGGGRNGKGNGLCCGEDIKYWPLLTTKVGLKRLLYLGLV